MYKRAAYEVIFSISSRLFLLYKLFGLSIMLQCTIYLYTGYERMSIPARLSEDLIIEILTRLPVKPLMQFKCVSKAWHSLISDPQFAKVQLRRASEGNSTSHQRIIKSISFQTIDYEAADDGREDDPAAEVLHIPGNDPDQWFKLVGHCDGLVCLAGEEGYMLHNPTTRQSRMIPNSSLVAQDYFFQGFGYDPMTDGSKEAEMEIFTLKSNSWRRSQNSHVTDPHGRGIYLSGALHWFVYRNTIVSFDLVEEKFKQVLPLETDQTIEFDGLGVFGNRLFLYDAAWRYRMEAWIMNEYGKKESWTELFNVPTNGIPGVQYWTIPLSRTKNGKIALDGGAMILFNPEDDTFKTLPVTDIDWDSAIYVESLVSPY